MCLALRAICRLTTGENSPDNPEMADIYDFVIKKLRDDERSLVELEKACGVPSTTIRDIKSGKVSPRIDTLRKIAGLYTAQGAAA